MCRMTFPSLHNATHLYFITATICGWKQLFVEQEYVKIVLDSLSWLQINQKLLLFAFVLMPSYLHAIIKPENETIDEVLQTFGSFTAHSILKKLQEDDRSDLIQFFHEQRRDKRHAHSIWQDIQAKNIYSEKFLEQKLEYIHSNPVRKDWELVVDRADYKYSSACLYDREIQPIIEVTDVREWLS